MKKYLTLAALMVAIASYGGITSLAHAQSASATDQAAIQQSLDVLKAKLVNLEAQQGLPIQGDGGSPAVVPGQVATPIVVTTAPVTVMAQPTLSASDVASLKSG